MKKTIIVSGLTRCGSSLTMQMLHAGGMPVSCAPGNEAISGEHESQMEVLKILALGGAVGMAIKCLDPNRFPIPKGDYIILWCCRDFTEQAKSITKFMQTLGIRPNRKERKKIESELPNDTVECMNKLKKLGPVFKIKFEDTINDPEEAARKIAEILSEVTPLDSVKMASVVFKREAKCYDGFLETELIKNAL